MAQNDMINVDRVEMARQAFMRGEMSAEAYWAIRCAEYSKYKNYK